MKRLLALWLVAALLSGGLTATGAETEEKVNLFQNPGFEEMTPEKETYDDFNVGKPIVWGSFNGWTDDSANNQAKRARHTKEIPHGGSTYCANIRLPAGYRNSPYVSQTVKNLAPGGIYEIGFHARSPKYASEFLLQITFYKNGETVRTQNMLRTLPSPSWKEYKLQFPFPEDADSMLVQFKLGGYGDIYLDDVFLYKVSDKPVYTLETDAVFYYSDDLTPAVAKVVAENPGNATASFVLKEGNTVVADSDPVSFNSGAAKWEFPVFTMQKEKTAYTLEVTVTKNGEKTLLTEEIYRYPRPSRLRSDGVYLKNGEPFVPVMAHGINNEHLAKCKEAGINVVTVSYWYTFYDEYTESGVRRIDYILEQLDKYDLMGIIGLYRYMMPSGAEVNLNNTKKLIGHLNKHEHRDHIFAYSMMDEPLQNDAWCDATLKKGYREIRDLDKDIPVLTVDCSDKASITKRNISYCDIYSCDAYYDGNGELAKWPGEMVALAKSVADEGQRTVYHLTQAFAWDGRSNILPTADEVRHMIYQAFLNGAQGVGYYTFSEAWGAYNRERVDLAGNPILNSDGSKQYGRYPLHEKDDFWPGFCKFGTGDLPLAADHFVLGKGEKLSDIKGDGFCGRTFTLDGKLYALILNENDKPKTVSVALPFEGGAVAAYYGETKYALSTDSKILSVPLAARECVLLESEERSLTFNSVCFYKEDGTPQDTPQKGETVIARVQIPKDKEITYALLGSFAKSEMKELIHILTLQEEETEEPFRIFSAKFTVPQSGLTYKAFMWDEMLRP